MNWREAPTGMIRHDELVNILVGLDETGGCDRRTLRIVAQSVGIREHFDRRAAWLQATGKSVSAGTFLLVE
jgi:hypothetical protein